MGGASNNSRKAVPQFTLPQALSFVSGYERRGGRAITAAQAAKVRAAIASLEGMLGGPTKPAQTNSAKADLEQRQQRLAELELIAYAPPRFRR